MSSPDSPFHAGEQAVQERLGVRSAIEPWARKVVRPALPAEHREFYAALPFLVAAARDGQGRPWATLLAGRPGFASSPDPGQLEIEAQPPAGDALEGALVPGVDVGLLGIDLSTRRRNRVNGRVASADAAGFVLGVEQAFGNCPQYIHTRSWHEAAPARPPRHALHRSFNPALAEWIEQAKTFFIASGHRGDGESPSFGTDASHRGGQPGFVRVRNERKLMIPDYAGNNHFNTLGNLLLDPRAGLLFVDFERGDLLQLTGRIEIEWDVDGTPEEPGARRLLHFELDQAIELRGVLPLRWEDTGAAVRTLRVIHKIRESEDVCSFVFEPRDGGPLADFEAGQYLPIELQLDESGSRVRRTYSLSSSPGDTHYRISVKRETRGLVSQLLHDQLEAGDFVDAGAPAGDFVLRHGDRPIVLASAGVGLTPMVSMLRHLTQQQDPRSVWYFHGARDGRHQPLAAELAELRANPRVHTHVAFSRPSSHEQEGSDFDSRGRLHAALLAEVLPDLDADFYLCGPAGFLASLQEGLEQHGVPPERVHFESFGPAG